MNKIKNFIKNPPTLIKILGRIILIFIIILLLILLGIFIINRKVINYTDKYIVTEEELEGSKYDCIVVLGASVKSNGTPSTMLADRLDEAIVLYNMGISNKLLMSGDHTGKYYNEVTAMKNYAIKKDVSSEDIFLDHYGSSTYNSMYRLKEVFNVDKVVIVTQDYHLYRALYTARKEGIDAVGVASNQHTYKNQFSRDIRENIARVKDYFYVLFNKKGDSTTDETISIFGNGDTTNKK